MSRAAAQQVLADAVAIVFELDDAALWAEFSELFARVKQGDHDDKEHDTRRLIVVMVAMAHVDTARAVVTDGPGHRNPAGWLGEMMQHLHGDEQQQATEVPAVASDEAPTGDAASGTGGIGVENFNGKAPTTPPRCRRGAAGFLARFRANGFASRFRRKAH